MLSNTTSFERVQTRLSGEVAVAADAFWKLLLDWPAILTWMRTENAPVYLTKVELKPGHRTGSVPCTRLCYVDTAKVPAGLTIPAVSAETLLHADPVARTIYYCIEGDGPFGMRNYLATTEVDDLGNGCSRITCSGRWDLPAGAPVELIRVAVTAVYDSIIHDISATVQGHSPARGSEKARLS